MKTKQGTFTIDNNIGNHSNDPFVVKKLESARKRIEKYGLPPQLLELHSVQTKKRG
ncbi:hypothetical protein [Pedobacter frigoris]|uniref:hypothetical protein n=1 Tax=Pedobacter frigoris TaxID=2571272 RepID=UPI00145E83A8|nr:hypothetical protein [Pedobacter frigoris]